MPRRTKVRLPKRLKQPLMAPTRPNHIWYINFMHDTLYRWNAFRILNVIYESNQEALSIEIDLSVPSGRVISVLEQQEEIHGRPEAIRLHNGPELRSAVFTEWCEGKSMELKYIQRGSHSRIGSLNALTAPAGMKCSMPICSTTLSRLGRSPRHGLSRIMKKVQPRRLQTAARII